MKNAFKRRLKVCLAASAGGHLTELLQLKDSWKSFDYFFVSDKRINAIELSEKERVYFVLVPRRNPLKFIINFFQSLIIFLKEKPDVVLTTGADVAFASCLIAKLFGKKVLFLESFAQVFRPSLSGKLAYKFADVFFVQWPELLDCYPKAVYAGSVF